MSDEEEIEDDESEEEKETRMKRAVKKMDNFMTELAEDLLSPGEYKKLVAHIRDDLKTIGVTYTNLKAYQEGFIFGIKTVKLMGDQLPPIMAGVRKMVSEEGKRIKKKATDAMEHGERLG